MKCQARLTPRSERISRPCCPLFRCFSWRGGWTILEGVFDPDTPRDEIENITVVYAEDDERLGRLTAQYLRSHGIQVELVTRGDQALAEVLRVRPDAVLLDLMLPGRSGLEVCRDLRAHVDVPILMVTARGEEADMVLGLEGAPTTTSRSPSLRASCSRGSAPRSGARAASPARARSRSRSATSGSTHRP